MVMRYSSGFAEDYLDVILKIDGLEYFLSSNDGE